MRAVYFAIGVLFANAAGAADLSYESQFCSNISEYVRADDVCNSSDCCPADLSNLRPGPNLDSTSTDVLVDTNKGQDSGGNTTMYVCAWPTSGSAPTEAQVIAGSSPCTDALSKAVSASGEVHFEAAAPAKITGLSASTEYKISAVHEWESRATDELLESAPFTTFAGGGGGGTDLTGTGFFVDSSASAGGDGLSPSTAWDSLDDVNNNVTAEGSDVYLAAGSVFEDEEINMDWVGSSGDNVIVDTYCIDTGDGNRPKAWTDGGTGCTAKAEINGTYPADPCSDNTQCNITSAEANDALINVGGPYTQIRNLTLKDSKGHFILANNTDHPVTGTAWAGVQVVGVEGDHSANGPLILIHHEKFYIANNVFTNVGMGDKYRESHFTADGTDGGNRGNNVGGIAIARSRDADGLVEGNTIAKGWSEGYNCLSSTHIVFRGNKGGELESTVYYADNCQDAVFEQNIGWGDPNGEWGNGQDCLKAAAEFYSWSALKLATQDVLFRNNLCTGSTTGIFGAANGTDGQVHFDAYGNTFAGNSNAITLIPSSRVVKTINIKNNAFTETGCSNDTSDVDSAFSHNAWPSGPPAACTDSDNDVTGSLNLATDTATLIAKTYDVDDPDQADFETSDPTVIDDVGVDLTATAYLTKAEFVTALSFMTTKTITDDQWAFALFEDFSGEARDGVGAEDIGALANP